MRYLIFGDVHGNLPALEKMLEVEKDNYDRMVCHGDVINYAPWSNECVQKLSEFEDIICLQGNHEKNYLSGNYTPRNEVAKAFFEFCYPKFSEFDKIEDYTEEFQVDDFQIQHTIDNQYIFPDTDLIDFEISKNYIIGHSHYQFDRKYNDFRVVNTGSLGQNRKLINVSEYVLFDSEKNQIELKSFLNDIDVVIKEMKQKKYPEICIKYYENKPRL